MLTLRRDYDDNHKVRYLVARTIIKTHTTKYFTFQILNACAGIECALDIIRTTSTRILQSICKFTVGSKCTRQLGEAVLFKKINGQNV